MARNDKGCVVYIITGLPRRAYARLAMTQEKIAAVGGVRPSGGAGMTKEDCRTVLMHGQQ